MSFLDNILLMRNIFELKFTSFASCYPHLVSLKEDCFHAIQLAAETHFREGTIFTCGNGGSAADAEHIAGELLKGFISNRDLLPKDVQQFQQTLGHEKANQYYQQLQRGIRCISLIDHQR